MSLLEDFTHEMSDEVWQKGEISICYVVPYEILKRVGKVACELKLPNELAQVHPVFHVSVLKKYIGDPVNDNLFYEDVPVKILDRKSRD